jgi:hypothetical protein
MFLYGFMAIQFYEPINPLHNQYHTQPHPLFYNVNLLKLEYI